MLEASLIPLPLADSDGVVKVVIGIVVALIWIFAQVASSISTGRKKQEAQRRRVGLDLPPPGVMLPPVVPPRAQSRAGAPDPRYVPRSVPTPAPRPMPQAGPRQVPQHIGQMQQWASEQPQRPVVQPKTPTPRSYDELRQRKQQPQQGQPVRRQPDQRKPAAPQQPARLVVAQAVGASLASSAARGAARPRGAAGDISAGEIGHEVDGLSAAAARSQLRGRARALLTPRSIREAILASELLRPPLALREGDSQSA